MLETLPKFLNDFLGCVEKLLKNFTCCAARVPTIFLNVSVNALEPVAYCTFCPIFDNSAITFKAMTDFPVPGPPLTIIATSFFDFILFFLIHRPSQQIPHLLGGCQVGSHGSQSPLSVFVFFALSNYSFIELLVPLIC